MVSRVTTQAVANQSITFNKLASDASLPNPRVANVQIANSSYSTINDTAVSADSGGYVIINGAGFVTGCTVLVGTIAATSTTFINNGQIRAQLPARTAGTYPLYVVNPLGSVAILINGITYSGVPSWISGSTLDSVFSQYPISIYLYAAGAVSYALQTGSSLPPGLNLSANGFLSGTAPTIEANTSYSFTVEAIDNENQESPRSFSLVVTVSTSDANFINTTLLLQATSNTYLHDWSNSSSYVNVAVSNTKASAFSPYNTTWSMLFDTNDYATVPANTSLNVGNGSFTVECWAFSHSNAATQTIFNLSDTGSAFGAVKIQVFANLNINWLVGGGSSWSANLTSGSFLRNSWNHLAVSRTGANVQFFLNGTQTGANQTIIVPLAGNSTSYFGAGTGTPNYLDGYISDFRLTIGNSLYITTFTPPTSKLTASTNTALLIGQSNRFVDVSNNAFTVSPINGASISSFSPFIDSDTTSGSAYQGNTGYYTINGSNNFNVSTDDFTMSCWIHPLSDQFFIYDSRDSANDTNGMTLYRNSSGKLVFGYAPSGSATSIVSNANVDLNSWSHVLVSRNLNSVKLFLNGVVANSATVDTSITRTTNIRLGASFENTSSVGYMSEFYFRKGAATYTSNFTPPSTPEIANSGTSILTFKSRIEKDNNNFIDQSGSKLVGVNKVGNCTPSTFSPYGNNWSVDLSSSGSLSVPANANWSFPGDFTIEGWMYFNTISGSPQVLIGMYDSALGTWFDVRWFGNSNDWQISLNSNVGSGFGVGAEGYPKTKKWHHVAFVRSGSSIKFYLDGINHGSTITNATTIGYGTTYPLQIGIGGNANQLNGYVSNVRILRGTALYTSNFTPPNVTPLTAITNTVLLTAQSNRLRDNSTANAVVSNTGVVAVTNWSPYPRSTEYQVQTYGGSILINGSGSYIKGLANDAFVFRTNDFTWEAWVYPTSSGGQRFLSVVPSRYLGANGSGVIQFNAQGTFINAVAAGYPVNQWSHIAASRVSGTLRIFLNGVQQGSNLTDGLDYTETNINEEDSSFEIGSDASLVFTISYYADVRISKNGLYSTNFTPPTAPLAPVRGTTLLLNGTSTPVYDRRGHSNEIETINVRPSNLVTKYNNSSFYFSGSNSYMTTTRNNKELKINLADFTIEAWVYTAVNNTANGSAIITQSNTAAIDWEFGINRSSGGPYGLYFGTGASLNGSYGTYLTANTWYHIAAVRSGTNLKLFVDGSVVSNTSFSTNLNANNQIFIGKSANTSTKDFSGYIDDLRVTVGVARYTTTFTPPTRLSGK
jgi:hypothetical protein